MKIIRTILVMLLLSVNGITATYGGLSLMVYPDGSGLGLPLHLLGNTPFGSYFIPGLLLLLTNGLSSLYVGWCFISGHPRRFQLVKVQGAMLVSYISIQVFMIDVIVPLHIICGVAGLLMILLGYLYERPLKAQKRRA